MKTPYILLLGLAVAVLAACNPLARDPGVDAHARRVYDEVRRGDGEALAAHLAPELRNPSTAAQLGTVRRLLPPGEAQSRKALGASTFITNGATTVTTVDEYDYGDRVAQVHTRLHRTGAGPWQVQGFHAQVATEKELAANNFNLLGKSPLHFLILAVVIGSPLLMIAALVKVLRTSGLKRKWLWGILAFLGLAKIQMNWATGAFAYQLFTVQLVGFGVMRGLSRFDPWLLTFTLPIGAMLILTGVWANPRRARKARDHKADPSTKAEPEGEPSRGPVGPS